MMTTLWRFLLLAGMSIVKYFFHRMSISSNPLLCLTLSRGRWNGQWAKNKTEGRAAVRFAVLVILLLCHLFGLHAAPVPLSSNANKLLFCEDVHVRIVSDYDDSAVRSGWISVSDPFQIRCSLPETTLFHKIFHQVGASLPRQRLHRYGSVVSWLLRTFLLWCLSQLTCCQCKIQRNFNVFLFKVLWYRFGTR